MLFLLDSYSARVREEKVARLLRARMRLQHAARIRRASCDKGVQTELEDPKESGLWNSSSLSSKDSSVFSYSRETTPERKSSSIRRAISEKIKDRFASIKRALAGRVERKSSDKSFKSNKISEGWTSSSSADKGRIVNKLYE